MRVWHKFVFISLWLSVICVAKPPELTSHETKSKIEEILRAHATFQALTPELIRRAMQNYLEELDPSKTYLVEPEIQQWVEPSHELLVRTLDGIHKEDFSMFEEIHGVVLLSIQRRERLEGQIASSELPKDVQPSEFKDIKWAKSEEDLGQRLLRIKALQVETAEKFSMESREQFLQRLTKRRLKREEEISAHSSPEERQRIVLSYVLKAVSSALDSQTNYFTPAEANQFMIQVQQRLYGIGAQLRDDLNGFTLVRLVEGGPASDGKQLKVGDKIVAVDRVPVVGMEITEAVELIRGQEGTSVLLTLLRKSDGTEERIDVEIVRGEVILKESRLQTAYQPCGEGAIGIVHLFSFYQDSKHSSAIDMQEAIQKMKKMHHLEGIILDLRSNAGGLLPQAVSVASLFLAKGVIVSVKDNTNTVQRLRNLDGKPVWDGPLIVLTNRASASAAEIVAGTLQDYGRALIVGDPETYGKGTFQSFTLESSNFGKINPQGEYKVTRGRYYTVSGRSPQLMGVKADIEVPGLYAQMEIGERYAKFPLESDTITSSFEDDLSDIPFLHRRQVERLYKFNLQSVMTTYRPLLDRLRKNSEMRIQQSPNYQALLKESGDVEGEPSGEYGQGDLQLEESVNVMKDVLFFLQNSAVPQRAAA